MTQKRRFLFTAWDGGGNVPPMIGLARQLVARGHAVHVLGDPTLAPEVEEAGARHLPWTTAPHRTSRHRDHDLVKDYEGGSPLVMIRKYVADFLGAPAPRWVADTLAAIERTDSDVLVADQTLPATLIAAEKAGITSAAYSPNIWMLPTPGIPPFGTGLSLATGPIGRARDWLLHALTRRLFSVATPYLNDERVAQGLPKVDSVYDQMTRADRVIVLTSPKFDFTSPAMPKHVVYGGAVLDDPSWCAPWTSPWSSDDERPLVLVGLSSTYQNQAATLRNIVSALSELPVRALLTLGLTIEPEEVRAASNVVVVRSASHAAVLREASLLITHCGHGTTMRGLAAGVPLVCLPMGRDQNDTAERVAHRGAGLRLKPTDPPAKIRAAVARILADPSFRERAQDLGRAIREREGCVDPIEVLESLPLRRVRANDYVAAEA